MNHEKYSDRTAEMAMKNVDRGKVKLSPKAIYAKFQSLPIAEKYNVIKYKASGTGSSIILTTDTNVQLQFTITRKGWMLEAV